VSENRLQKFRARRAELNEKVLDLEHLGVKRFYNMDAAAFRAGELDAPTKELLGLVASTVLRCNDCIDYHLEQAAKAGWTKNQIVESLYIAMFIGGSIVIPHFRHAVETLEFLEEEGSLSTSSTSEKS
jgi:AhpD family alkylhydroperoxidase